jgi:hypothetical protein
LAVPRQAASLRGLNPVYFSAEKLYLAYTRDFDSPETNPPIEPKHEYFSPPADAPEWWDVELRAKERIFSLPSVSGRPNYGQVVASDETETVHVYVSWS